MTGDTHHRRQAGASVADEGCARCRRCSPSRSPPRSARTTSSSARRCTSWWKRTLRSPSSTIPRRTRSWCGGRAKCICASPPSGWPTASASPSSPASRRVGYRETIKKPVLQRGRHKKQSGGHGQYGDVVLDIKPLPRGAGFVFEEEIKGGVVPRNYIPSVEEGVQSTRSSTARSASRWSTLR